jgi:hypothetical protein
VGSIPIARSNVFRKFFNRNALWRAGAAILQDGFGFGAYLATLASFLRLTCQTT